MSESTAPTYLVCGSKSWNRRVFDETLCRLPGIWQFVSTPAELSVDLVERLQPRYSFFLHWSHKVSNSVLQRTECICFHMTDVPYGRGGSPLQNLILRGHRQTMLTALRMTDDLDAGPVYLKEPMSLEGNAEQIYVRSANLAAQMISQIIATELAPVPQAGEPTVFHRRKPTDSELPANMASLDEVYDFVRMLDADGYPRAFLRYGIFRLEFARIGCYDGKLVADVTVTADGDRSA